MQAVILVGGEGTRLRPLTSTVPKPVVPLVDRPFMVYMLEWLRGHGVDDVIMSCGFMATKVRDVLGDGSELGISLRFVEEPEPRGTAGALKFAEEFLDERFLMLNGDVLTDIDLSAQIAQHERTGATGTLALVPVAGPVELRPRAPARGRRGRGVPREARARRGPRHEPHLRRRLRPGALGARPHRAGPQRLDRARDLARARRQRPLRLRRRRRLLARHRHARALPAGDLRHPRGQRAHGRVRGARRRTSSPIDPTATRRRARDPAVDRRGARARSPPARTSAASRSSPTTSASGRARPSSAASSSRARRSAPAASCATASSVPEP